jgi:hypothetical protein
MNYQNIFDTASPGSFRKQSLETRELQRAATLKQVAQHHPRTGVKHTTETIDKIRATKLKAIMTPNGVFPSRLAVAQAAGVHPTRVSVWVKKWPKHYYYVA